MSLHSLVSDSCKSAQSVHETEFEKAQYIGIWRIPTKAFLVRIKRQNLVFNNWKNVTKGFPGSAEVIII